MEGERLKSPDLHVFGSMGRLWLGLLFLAFVGGCEDSNQVEAPSHPVNLPISFHAEGKHHRLDIVIGSAAVAPKESAALSLKDSVRIDLVRPDGRAWARVRAKSGQSLRPYKQVTLYQFLWETEDSTEITGESLIWDRDAALPVHAPGEVELITAEGLIMGEDLRGDLLLRRFEIQRVLSVVRWDDVAGDSLHSPQ